MRSIPEDKAFLQSPRPSVEGLSAPLRHALQNSLVRTALKNGALICTWCGPGLSTLRSAARTRRGLDMHLQLLPPRRLHACLAARATPRAASCEPPARAGAV